MSEKVRRAMLFALAIGATGAMPLGRAQDGRPSPSEVALRVDSRLSTDPALAGIDVSVRSFEGRLIVSVTRVGNRQARTIRRSAFDEAGSRVIEFRLIRRR